MDTIKPHKIKARKTKKSTHQTLSSLFFRTIEITVVVVTVAKLFYQLVVAFENSGERFHGLAAILANRHFVFVFGNAIVIALLAKYCQFPNQESDARSTSNGFYEDFVRDSRREERNSGLEVKNRGKQSIAEIEVKNRGKQSIAEIEVKNREKQSITGNEVKNRGKQSITGVMENKEKQMTSESRQRQIRCENKEKEKSVEIEGTTTHNRGKQSSSENGQRQKSGDENRTKQSKSYVRSRSENLGNQKITCGRLERSATEKTRDLNDGMSNDELRFKIESFIARQRRNQKDEEFCIT